MRNSRLFAAGLSVAVGPAFLILLSGLSTSPSAQTAASQAGSTGLKCNAAIMFDPFKGKLAGKDIPDGVLPVSDENRSTIMNSGLPCQEKVTPSGQEDIGLENLQRDFDFYSWRTFIALNSPADGSPIEKSQADTLTRWESMDNFKQLLDVMLPARMQPPRWPADKGDQEKEKARLMPEQCLALSKEMPDRMVVKMIEESYNEPFKTGPLIDQQGHYAIFDILMNRTMFKYISDNNLFTKAGQKSAANSGLAVDFPPGQSATGDIGAFMLKVSWKILSPEEKAAKNFHMVDALVLMPPPDDPKLTRPCLPETLGLIGFHAVHKTASRPQWIWTSFEHKQNVPDREDVAAGKFDGRYNFYDVNCKTGCPMVNATPPRPWTPVPALHLQFRKDDTFKSQIVRETPLTNAAKNMNTIFHSMLKGTVWDNYMLLSTQWPSAFGCTSLHSQGFTTPAPKTDFVKQPDMTCSPAPTYFANSTLETYSQADNQADGEVPLATSSCIACHGNAVSFQTRPSNPKSGEMPLNQSDFTFILEKAQ
jgi:hypothetical protein